VPSGFPRDSLAKDRAVEAKTATLLEALNSLSVNSALWALRTAFNSFFSKASQLPLESIDSWVTSLDNHSIEARWNFQKQMKRPHLFLYAMFGYFKLRTLREDTYRRMGSKRTTTQERKDDFDRHLPIANLISQLVLPLPFYEGVAILGQLAGAWMMTCPESTIRSEHSIEHVGKWLTGHETTEWNVPSAWFEMYDPENDLRSKFPATELKLLYTLDFWLNLAFEDYDVNNTRD